MKNKVEDHSRNVKSNSNKTNRVSEPVCNANVKHTMLNANSELICVKFNQCMFDANHDLCFLEFVNDVNVRSKSKFAKSRKQKKTWKPTGNIFTDIGYRWKPTGQTFTLAGNTCPLTRIAFTKVEPLKETTLKLVTNPNPEIKIYRRKTKVAKLIAKIMDFGDYQLGNVRISQVYYVEGLGIICTLNHLAKQGLVRGLPKLKFKKDHLCSACSLRKSKKSSHKPKAEDTNQEKIYLLHMDICGPMRVESINGKKYILVIVDDYSRFTWVKFLRSKDEA
ncbi:integrase, catalytic region, zinc finger, CCHC-type containing protein [Tanacetum coccineum]|uniref:Integrase, catalytic region, zinc finger, CCHC-type containing protein n=1 Tax=Tanacetum coccineum TaxID=301880 RepID=A0ABQ5DGI4_9ASTR